MMERIETSACGDCLMWHENGDLSAVDLLPDADRDAIVARVTAAAGIPSGYHYAHAGDPEGFRWAACGLCQSGDAGDRHAVYLWPIR
jgi:hypothetical protein